VTRTFLWIEHNIPLVDRNVGPTDRAVRTAVGAVTGAASLGVLADAVPLPSPAAPVLGVVALILLGTAATGTGGAYSLLGVDTR
jgi:hypothetical protein